MHDPSGLPRTLNLGSGPRPIPGALNVDVSAEVGADVVHDLDVRPWPLPSDHFERVVAADVLEHVRDLAPVLEELHRVCAPGARVELSTPHFSSRNAYTDPTHRRAFGFHTLDYFIEGHPLAFYSRARFRLVRRSLVFQPRLVNKLVWRLANRFPDAYEERWAWIFPAWFVSAELEVVKPAVVAG